MKYPKSQYAFDSDTMKLFREKLLLDLPALERITVLIREFCRQQKIAEETSPCRDCAQWNDCKKPCERLNSHLHSPYKGRGRRENLTGLHPDTLQTKEIIRRKDIFSQYDMWKDDFTKKQWIVVTFYYKDCMTEQQIAKKLRKARSTVNGLLLRAKKRKDGREKQLRQETRQQITENEERKET